MKKKNLKRSLFLSVLSLLLCVSTFVGTTFAWFSETITNQKNKIMAGNLDVALYYMTEDMADWEEVDENTVIFPEDALWEPGFTQVVYFKVVNEGTLALKYQFAIDVVDETTGINVDGDVLKLSDHIKFGVVQGDTHAPFADRADAIAKVDATSKKISEGFTKAGELVAGTTTTPSEQYVSMAVYMPSTVGNEANYKTGTVAPVINLGIELYATQMMNEDDSFGDDYDEGAVIASTAAEAQAALDNADANTTIKLAPGVNYGTLVLRQSALSKVVDISDIGGDAAGNEKYRKIEGLTILGEGAIVDAIVFETGRMPTATVWSYLDVKDLTVQGVTFSGTRTAVNLDVGGSYLAVDGIKLVDCKMTDAEHDNRLVYQPYVGYKTITDKTTGEEVMTCGVKNLTITGCEVNGAHQVLEARPMENVTITNNTFIGVKARDILLSGNDNVTYTGTITVTGNTSMLGEERFVRMASAGDANVVIKDNTILNYEGEDADYIKVTDSNRTPVIENNIVGRSVYGLTLIPDGDNSKIIVSDKEGFLNLTKLFADWTELFTDGNGTTYTNYANGAGVDYYYSGRWTVSIEADIDLNNATISPVVIKHPVSAGAPTFDGNNHTISNAKIVTDATTENGAGLFNASGIAFKNLKLDNIHVTGSNVGNSTAGVLAGSCNFPVDNITITNSSVTGGKYTGGVVGYAYTSITNCTLTNVTVKGGYKLGGVIGYICASSPNTSNVTNNTLTDCSVDGIGGGVFAGGKDKYIIGKLVGNYNCDGICNNNTITNMTTSATENIGEIEAGKTVTQ